MMNLEKDCCLLKAILFAMKIEMFNGTILAKLKTTSMPTIKQIVCCGCVHLHSFFSINSINFF